LNEYRAWLDGLNGMENVNFILIDDLNHMMAPGDGPSTPDEYQDFSEVDNRIGSAITYFIKD
jgi:hypothetical protein